MSTREDELIARVLQRAQAAPAARAPDPAGEPRDPSGTPWPRPARPAAEPRVRDGNGARSEAALTAMPGLGAKMRVPTSFGALPVEALRRRDELRTARGTFVAVAHVDRMTFDSDFLHRHEAMRPVVIRAGSLGRGMPGCDIQVSPAQKISTSKMPQPGSFKRAGELLTHPGVMHAPVELMTYYRFHIGEPAAFHVEGLWVLMEP